MLYKILFYPSRLALHFYCRKIIINNKTWLHESGPLLIAANHPNSFLDAVIISTVFKKPVYSLARGDAFMGKFFTSILKSCNMLPVYRKSEGVENLTNNYTTFDACKKLFEENKIVLIFCEGGSTNEWRIRPLKKGTARLAIYAWQNHIELKVLPLGINYNSFRRYGKNIHLNFGNSIAKKDVLTIDSNGKSLNEFNEKLNNQLKNLVYEIDKNDSKKLEDHFYIKSSLPKKIFLCIPAIIGFLIHAPLYSIIHLIIKKRALDHYDSIMIGLLFFLYPLYVFAIATVLVFVTGSLYSWMAVLFVPFMAWSYLQLKRQIEK